MRYSLILDTYYHITFIIIYFTHTTRTILLTEKDNKHSRRFKAVIPSFMRSSLHTLHCRICACWATSGKRKKRKKDINTKSYLVLFCTVSSQHLCDILTQQQPQFLAHFPFTLCTPHLCYCVAPCSFFSLNSIHKTWKNTLFPEFLLLL